MRLNEVVRKVDLSKRAVKYYEEKGLLKVKKDSNGYRNYTPEDVKILEDFFVPETWNRNQRDKNIVGRRG